MYARTTAATAILEEELDRWSRERATRAAVPALVALRRHFERARAQVLAHGGGMDAEAATRLLVNRLLHEPTTALKALSAEPAHTAEERRRIERTLLKLFGGLVGISDAFTADARARVGLLPGLVLTVRNATEVVLRPVGAIAEGGRGRP